MSPRGARPTALLDALAPMSVGALATAGDDLTGHLQRLGPDVRGATRVLTPRSLSQEHP
jgi:hypothetical protein